MIKTKLATAMLTFGLLSAPSLALEPLPDRARVQNMNTDLLLPDGSTLNVDVSFDCGSDYQNTAVMVMSDSGAKLIAAAYTHLYGEAAGQAVIDTWQTKQNATDPRKPTYLFILAPREQDFNWKAKKTNKLNNLLSRVSISETKMASQTLETEPKIPVVLAGCGVRDHNPNAVK
ncbi:hypothetical protein [Pseudoalteromonas luteoviolacea]|uniref:Uncharacterized protein n=1 Tax=Pseudoalteromonas luteoviolacea S4054 TaxID=1129367 RepID=A0A0F6ADD1_9GAMM|nr:hypothetical protein [Pseudoalteromonas luteoviolacea]AOT08242.1 hypothetical protein S4054249_10495 [Pseudoalteromonas luteoviolacea]AOT13158.1 hypothetical protein S40542_10470 [Pseudoalteromonas luteoviolacea]AOT18070.1 hypothetical protein S4054_10465 [Pseudoalteromonas luteoviolacea]KKE84173.1 hypothetical protein N479_09750 [Pseudoalteromonas luteoviolacea S4054]KZN76222.1 hypothetical protein N481_07665 [Pseudoalteromonas luteoviolacea S4047-1]